MSVTMGAQLIAIATIVSLKYLTAMKLTKMAKFPVMTLILAGPILKEKVTVG